MSSTKEDLLAATDALEEASLSNPTDSVSDESDAIALEENSVGDELDKL